MMHWVCCIKQAGMHAVRKNRYVILPKDFEKVCNRLVIDRAAEPWSKRVWHADAIWQTEHMCPRDHVRAEVGCDCRS